MRYIHFLKRVSTFAPLIVCSTLVAVPFLPGRLPASRANSEVGGCSSGGCSGGGDDLCGATGDACGNYSTCGDNGDGNCVPMTFCTSPGCSQVAGGLCYN